MLRASAATRAASSGAESAAAQRASIVPPWRTRVGTTRSRLTRSSASLLASVQVAIEAGSAAMSAAGIMARRASVSNRGSARRPRPRRSFPARRRRPPPAGPATLGRRDRARQGLLPRGRAHGGRAGKRDAWDCELHLVLNPDTPGQRADKAVHRVHGLFPGSHQLLLHAAPIPMARARAASSVLRTMHSPRCSVSFREPHATGCASLGSAGGDGDALRPSLRSTCPFVSFAARPIPRAQGGSGLRGFPSAAALAAARLGSSETSKSRSAPIAGRHHHAAAPPGRCAAGRGGPSASLCGQLRGRPREREEARRRDSRRRRAASCAASRIRRCRADRGPSERARSFRIRGRRQLRRRCAARSESCHPEESGTGNRAVRERSPRLARNRRRQFRLGKRSEDRDSRHRCGERWCVCAGPGPTHAAECGGRVVCQCLWPRYGCRLVGGRERSGGVGHRTGGRSAQLRDHRRQRAERLLHARASDLRRRRQGCGHHQHQYGLRTGTAR